MLPIGMCRVLLWWGVPGTNLLGELERKVLLLLSLLFHNLLKQPLILQLVCLRCKLLLLLLLLLPLCVRT